MSLRVVSTPLAGGALAQSALAGTAPDGWYARAPLTPAAWTDRCRRAAQPVASWVSPLAEAFGATGARLLSRVDAGNGVVVTTGQQPGLFGGPMYTWHKAIGALELAARIERETGVPAAPVFWAATDDADFAEAASTVVASAAGAERLALSQGPPEGVPMAHARLGAEVDRLAEALRASAGSTADPRPMRAAECFRAGVTMGDAYVAMLRQLLEPLGIAVLDVSHPAVAAAARGTLARALECASGIQRALAARTDAMIHAGFDVPVATDRALSLVFAWETGSDGLPRKRRLTIDESAAAATAGARLSANVLLRPIVEQQLLPTVAYAGGPGEIAYFAQVSAVSDAMSVQAPLIVPRWSGLLIPHEIDATLRQNGITADDLRDPHAAETRIARAAVTSAATDAVADLRAAIARNIAALSGVLTPAALEGAAGQLSLKVDRLERRILAAAKHREQHTLRPVAAARGMLYPFGKPQERALNAVPIWSRYGDDFVAAVRAACAAHAERLVTGVPVPA